MQSFTRGWKFLKQAWGMAFKDKDLLKPSLYALLTGMVISVIGIIPILIAGLLFGDSRVGQFIMGGLGAILLFVQFTINYVFSAMTIRMIYGCLTTGDGRMDEAWAIVRRDFFDILTLAAVSTLVGILRNLANKNRKNSMAGSLLRSAMRAVEALWTEASLLVLPAMIIDDLNLKDGLARIVKITKENLLLIGISFVGVRWVTGLIGFLFNLGGLVLAFGIGGGFVYLAGGSTIILVFGIGIGALIFLSFLLISNLFNSYTSTAYHTCLYIWARDVERATAEGRSTRQVAAPAPLAAVLS